MPYVLLARQDTRHSHIRYFTPDDSGCDRAFHPPEPPVVQTLAGLSALTRLRLGSKWCRSYSMPGWKELEGLHSTSIEDLTACLEQVLEVEAEMTTMTNNARH